MNTDKILQAAINAALQEAFTQIAMGLFSGLKLYNHRIAQRQAWEMMRT